MRRAALRLPGEGDSEGYSVRIDTALDAIRRAIRFMREDPEIEEIVLVGLRLGGTLAALIAARRLPSTSSSFSPPSRRGGLFAGNGDPGALVDILPDGSPMPKRAGVTSVAGFRLEPELIAELSSIDLRNAQVGRPPARSSCLGQSTRASRRITKRKGSTSKPAICRTCRPC